jgi:hypothetical protein
MHVEKIARRHIVRYVIEVPQGSETERPRRSMSWYFEQARARGLGERVATELLPEDRPRRGELW